MSDNWQSLAKRFAERRMALLADLRNHGRSPHVDSSSYPEMAQDVAAFLEDQWIHEVDVMGHSMGGKVAMQLALSSPDLVRKLIVVDMTPRQYPRGHDDIFAAMQLVPLSETLSRKQIDAILEQKIKEPGVRMFLMKNLKREKTGGYSWKMNLPVLSKDYEKILAPVEGEPFDKPTLFIRGGKSRYVKDEDARRIKELFPAATIATIPDAGHWAHADAPDELLSLVEEFLGV